MSGAIPSCGVRSRESRAQAGALVVIHPLTDKFLEGVIEWVMTWSNFQEAAPRCSRRTRHAPIYVAKGDIWWPLRGRDFLDCGLGSCRRGNRRPHHCLGSRGSVAGDKPSRSQNSPAEHQVPTIRRTAQYEKTQSLPQALARKRQLTKSSPHDAAYDWRTLAGRCGLPSMTMLRCHPWP
jgi:hypothetical protein